MFFTGYDLSYDDILNIFSDPLVPLYFSSTHGEFMHQIVHIDSGKVYEVADPVH